MAARNKEHQASLTRRHYVQNKDLYKTRAKARFLANPEHHRLIARKSHLKKYGLTIEGYEQLVAQQNNCCAICGCPANKAQFGKLVIDHSHQSGAVRGLICQACNAVLGYAKDSPIILAHAILYLEKHT